MQIRHFRINRFKKYFYLLLFPIYLFIGFLRLLRLIPRKYFIFGSAGGSAFIDNSKYFYLENQNNKDSIWISHSQAVINDLKQNNIERAYKSFSLKGIYYQLFSKMVIISHGTFDLLPPLLLNLNIVQFWHGIPIKKIGNDVVANQKSWLDKIWVIIFKIYPHLNNYYCNYFVDATNSEYYLKFIPFKPKIIKMGYPRWNSFLKKEAYSDYKKNKQLDLLKKINSKGIKIILYIPTYRDNIESQKILEEEIKKLAKIFSSDQNYYFVYKSHFVLNNELNLNIEGMCYMDLDPYPVLKLSSALITDYSSIGIDYLLLNRPLCFFIFDREKYEKHPGCYFDLDENLSELISMDFNDVYMKINSELVGKTNFSDRRKKLYSTLIDTKLIKNDRRDIKDLV